MPAAVNYALLPTLSANTRPIIFPDLDKLCRRIHRERAGAALQLVDHQVQLLDDPPGSKRAMVAVYTRLEDGAQGRFIGWAYLDGATFRTLQAALYAQEPNPDAYAEAA